MQRIAAIDAGSNAIRLIVADLDDKWNVHPVESVRVPVRLGQDAFTTGVLQENTIKQAVEAFMQFQNIIVDFGVSSLKAVATSAIREASNSSILIDRIAHSSSIELEVISGEEEARLVNVAVCKAVDLTNKHALLVDIGGGSVEITLTNGENILSANSYAMGTVRLLHKLDWDNAIRKPQAFGLLVREYVQAASKHIQREIGDEKFDLCIGTGGNVEEIGKLRQRLFSKEDDSVVRSDELERLVERLSAMGYQERIRKLNLRLDRADVILPAVIVLKILTDIAGVEEVHIPNVGLKNGILLDMAASMAQVLQLPKREQVLESANRIGRKYRFDEAHAQTTANLALRLFDQTIMLHTLDGEERLLLELAGLLHDVGHFINTIDHDKHGYYILKANRVIGLSERQQEILACIVRYHRKGIPFMDGQFFSALPSKDRRVVVILCAILRLADAMETSHTQRVIEATMTERAETWTLKLLGKGDLAIEKWAVMKRSMLFQDIFGVSLEVVV